jgi:hypothetical protein
LPRGGVNAREGADVFYEQDDVAPAANFIERLAQLLRDVTPVRRADCHRLWVEAVQLLIFKRLWNLTHADLLGQAPDHRHHSDTRLADKDRVVLSAQ